jgi:hypothetical protein
MELRSGQRICSRVRLLRSAGEDAGSRIFGEVWMAVDDQTGGKLWLTAIGETFVPSIFEVGELMAKATGLTKLRHPELVRVAFVDREEGHCVIGYEGLEGARLFSDLLLREKLDAEKVLRRATAVAKGLGYLHSRGVVHGVLSAATTFEWEGSTLAWQYGLLQALDPRPLGEAVRKASTEQLFAPELHRGLVSPRTDVWGWAALVAEMASGLSALEAVNETLDGGTGLAADRRLVALLQRCLSPDPDVRPADASAIVGELDQLSRSGAVVGLPTSVAPPPPKAETGSLPILEAGLPESGEFLELRDVDMVDTGPQPVRRAAAARARPAAHDSTAGLKALAREQLGDDAGPIARVLESTAARPAEPELLALAQDLARKERVGRPSLDVGLPDDTGLWSPRAHERAAPGENATFVLPRRPGPHGPTPAPMTAVFLIASLCLVAAPLAFAAREQGGVDRLLGLSSRPAPGAAVPEPGTPAPGAPAPDAAPETPPAPEPAPVPEPAPPPESAACPEGMAPIDDGVCIDRAEFPGRGKIPQVLVTLRQAATLCEGRDARLCSLAEWRLACEGGEQRRLPSGDGRRGGECNTASVAGFPQETAAAGAYAGCVTPTGVLDLVGNVGEWVAEGIAVGGDSSTAIDQATCRAQGRPPKGFAGPDLGFRCCRDR